MYTYKEPLIFVLSGKAKSGKNLIADKIENYYKNKRCIQISYAFYLKNYVKNIYDWNGSEEDKPRELLQKIGIDLIKNKIDSNLLIRRVCEDIKVYSYFYDIIIITDARLKDEIEIPKRLFNNAVTIRIDSIYYDKKMTIEQMNHITETNLDNYDKFDYIINDFDKLEEILSKI
ncbi:MAG: hypothetical protein SOT41_01860 [Candidatus Faecisoma sp.]|nr:hypothetical protein [Acholeplasma sp.]MDY2892513.1 hypothetical protein [Candidatus Faecisoma sp.]